MANKRHVTTEETGSNRPLVRRRAVIAAASALVAAAAARAVAPTAAVQAAGDSDDFVLGATNKTLGTTDLDLGGGSGPALLVRSSAGDGIVGQSLAGTSFNSPPPKGIGVLGRLLGPGPPSPAAELALSELSGGVVGFTDVAGGSGGGIELNSFQWGVASGTNLAGGTGGPALVGRDFWALRAMFRLRQLRRRLGCSGSLTALPGSLVWRSKTHMARARSRSAARAMVSAGSRSTLPSMAFTP